MKPTQVAANYAQGPGGTTGGVSLDISNNGDGTITLYWAVHVVPFARQSNWAKDQMSPTDYQPSSDADYVLEYSHALGEDAFWNQVVEIPVQDGAFYRLTLPVDQAAQYYRLRK